MTTTRITLIGRPGCHLCDDARAVVEQVAGELGVGWTEQSVDDDPALRAQWGDHIPVTLVDGRSHDFYRVSPDRLRAALSRPAPGPEAIPSDPHHTRNVRRSTG